jgi:6-phosphogluconolactonase (cycloisomerase 2 family)
VLVAVVSSVFLVASAAVAEAAPVGKLTFRDCLTGERASGPTPLGTGACSATAMGLTDDGNDLGLDNPESVAVSRDGRSLYVVSREDDALLRFDRNRDTGALTFAFCFTGEIESNEECETLPEASSQGADSGMDGPESVTVAPDGRSVYVTSRFDDSIFAFSRATTNSPNPIGFISPVGCVSGDSDTGPGGSGACSGQLPEAVSEGANSGFDDPKQKEVAISKDGEYVYAAGDLDDSVVRFNRDPSTSVLAFEFCFTGEEASGPDPPGSGACAAIPEIAANGQFSGLDGPRWVELSRDGRSLYVAADTDDAVARFSVNPTNGFLDWRQCVSGDEGTGSTGSDACTQLPNAAPNGTQSGLSLPRALALSDTHLYAVAANDGAIARFKLKRSGRPVFQGCLSADTDLGPGDLGVCKLTPVASEFNQNTGLDGMRDLEIKGRNLYTSAQFDAAVTTFNRDPQTGRITFARCITGESESNVSCAELATAAGNFGQNSGLEQVETVAVSRDGRNLYGGVEGDDAIARFKRKR